MHEQQLLIPPLGSAGTYAQHVAVGEDAPLACMPAGLDPVTAAALPTAGGAAMAIAESLPPLDGKIVLIRTRDPLPRRQRQASAVVF